MNVLELRDITVRYPAQRIRSLKEWVIRSVTARRSREELTVLHDVSLTLAAGDSLGVIGMNGAGKSTLLRVAAGIIRPSVGETVTRGQVAPIIELGTGFDGELSGRENIYFNAALLGRPRKLIARKFDDIVDFSGLEAFLDVPLRTYSTGMVARLAFSIATAVEADLVLLDEVLAVGDAAFTRRCEERIKSFYQSGSSVVVVSHDLDAIAELCPHSIWLHEGTIAAAGPTAEVLNRYRATLMDASSLHATVEETFIHAG